ncbi:AgmX/PglI C-terminal domain-containing protein [Marinobacter confluentis]|uniref:AgmX/PglI C-terminal domain-containing protein n=2 Tax=Marinobacter confluentis TaxID=1697557 RepID=A0A4Z1C8G0_9GAMM|nr:AgmX/PglI C-terminal domain-containing protein [Marinobacter confluentis]
MVAVFLPPALMIPAWNLPEPERSEAEEIPPQLARLIEQRKPPEPEIAAVPEPEPKPEPEPEPRQPEPAEEPTPEIVKTPEPAEPAPTPEQTREQTIEKAREKASRSGLLAMKDTLASMRSSSTKPVETLSANVNSNEAASAAEPADPDPSQALAGSGGVEQEQGMTREVAVADHNVRQVDVAEEKASAPAPQPQVADSGPSTRSMGNIRQVFDANKTSLNAMVGREQRKDPLLHGKILLKLVIEPDGSVSRCEVVESELDHPELEQRIAMRVRLFNFGAADVDQRELNFPLEFLPG